MTSYSIRDIPIVAQIDRARKDLDALKGSQFVSRSGLATNKVESQLITSTTVMIGVPTPQPMEAIYYTVTFHADTQLSPFGRLALEFYDMGDTRLGSESGIVVYYLNDIVTRVEDGILKWNLDIRTTGVGTIGSGKWRVKLIVYATDTGRISWQPPTIPMI